MIKTVTSDQQKIINPAVRATWPSLLLNTLWVVLTILPILIIAVQLVNYSLQVPLGDELTFIPFVAQLHTGGLTLGEIWQQHNEHRIVVWRVMALALAKVGGYNVPKETWVGLAWTVLTLPVLFKLLLLSVKKTWVGPMIGLFSWVVFSAVQWQNWYWGFQPSWFLANLLFLLAVLMLSYRPIKLRNFLLAMGLCVAATFTIGTSLAIWPALAVGIIYNWSDWRWKYLLGWLGTVVVTFGLFFYQYNFVPPSYLRSDRGYALQHPFETLTYIFYYLGAPVGARSEAFQGAFWFGLVILALSSLSAFWLWWRVRKDQQYRHLWEKSWPWLVISLFAVFNATIAAISRVSSSVEEAFQSRYTTISIWLWIGGGMLVLLAGQYIYAVHLQTIRLKTLLRFVGAGCLAFTVLCFGINCAKGLEDWRTNAIFYNETLPFFYDFQDAPVGTLGRLSVGNDPAVRRLVGVLNQYQEGPFQITKEQYQAAQDVQWQNRIKDNTYEAHAYPANLMVMTQGESGSIILKDDQMTFQHSGSTPTNIELDLSKLKPPINLLTPQKPLLVEIKMETAQFVQIFFDSGKGFNYGEYNTLAPALEPDGQRIFRVALPLGTKGIRVASIYRVAREQSDSVRVIIYTRN